MGLIKANGYYVRLDLDGTYWIYKNKKERLLEKKKISPTEVTQKYLEIIRELESDEEGLYYLGTTQLLADWQHEFYAYLQKDTSKGFPLMETYIKDVVKTIPEFISGGKINVTGNTLKDVYEYVKKYKVFGDTEDDL